jgi:hypothetical protein
MTASRGIITRTDVKPITIRYTINGAKFKRKWSRIDYREAGARIEALRENGITVKVSGFPKRITIKAEGK